MTDKSENSEPVLNGINFSERNAGLRHSERPGVHADENNAFLRCGISTQVGFVCFPRVIKRVVNIGDGFGKRNGGNGIG